MSKEKQIEEMDADITTWFRENFYEVGRLSNYLYNNGYRKQSEPISCGHEKGGEWVQLPCKVGDILYVISQMKDKRILPFINEYEVTSICIKMKSSWRPWARSTMPQPWRWRRNGTKRSR